MSRFKKWIITLGFLGGMLFLVLCIALVGLFSSLVEGGFGFYQSESREHLAVVRIEGPLYEPEPYLEQFQQIRENSACKGVLLRVNSPGGTVSASQEIFEALNELRSDSIPIVISMGNVAASGAYYISLCGTRIFCSRGTLTGSIGVIAQFPEAEKLFSKIGVTMETVKTGKFKDMGNPFRQVTRDEKQYLQSVLDDTFGQFLDDIIECRGLTRSELIDVADGRIMNGSQALRAGLVDTLGGLPAARRYLADVAGIGDEPLFIDTGRKENWLSEMLSKAGLLNKLFSGKEYGFSFTPGLHFIWPGGIFPLPT